LSRKDCDSSVDIEAQKVIIQLALLGGLDVLKATGGWKSPPN